MFPGIAFYYGNNDFIAWCHCDPEMDRIQRLGHSHGYCPTMNEQEADVLNNSLNEFSIYNTTAGATALISELSTLLSMDSGVLVSVDSLATYH